MEHQPLTSKAIGQSPDLFYQQIYPVMKMKRDQLIDIDSEYPDKKIIIVDSCGWFYQQMFVNADIYKIEGVCMCKNVSMSLEKIDSMFDDRNFDKLKFPVKQFPGSVLVIDHSTIFKYRTGMQIQSVLTDLTQSIQSELVHIRMPLRTTDDYRLSDRLHELIKIIPNGYVTTDFSFSIGNQMLVAKFKKLLDYASNIN